ncbi:MAG: ABC transporter permease [Ruminococcaceae bacterium]|nr:ABC transporter permease [Oscillospiraceae bacterium]
MKQFTKILRFELKNYFSNKIFIGVTIFLIIAIIGVMFFPRISESLSSSDNPPQTDELPIMIVSGNNVDFINEGFTNSFPDYNVVIIDESIEEIKERVYSGSASCAFVFESITKYTYFVNNLSMYDQNTYVADEILQELYRISAMTENGISPDDASEILSVQITSQTEILGKDQIENYFYTYIMIFALYMVIILYGQMIATNVATEKSSRAMELLITSANPVSMMFGKVIASCTAGFIQIAGVFGTALIAFNMNKEYWSDNELINSIFNMPAYLFVYMLVFFVLGFFIYAFMYGAIGSTASKLEDINTSVMPVTLIFVIAFMIVMMSIISNDVDTSLMKICSFIPFTSPMAMFTRLAMSSVPAFEIVVSIVLLMVSVLLIGYIAAKIYRIGVLLYGAPPKISSILKAIKNK